MLQSQMNLAHHTIFVMYFTVYGNVFYFVLHIFAQRLFTELESLSNIVSVTC